MVVTMLEARVEKDQADLLVGQFGAAGGSLPPFILESFLLHDANSDMWRILTVWASQDALDQYRASVETPEGVGMLRSAGAEPTLTVFEVAAHAAQP
jgi:heme-degrading monooxygenase HmoA